MSGEAAEPQMPLATPSIEDRSLLDGRFALGLILMVLITGWSIASVNRAKVLQADLHALQVEVEALDTAWRARPAVAPAPILREEFLLLNPSGEVAADSPLPPYAVVAPIPPVPVEIQGLSDFPAGALALSPEGQVTVFARDSASALDLAPG